MSKSEKNEENFKTVNIGTESEQKAMLVNLIQMIQNNNKEFQNAMFTLGQQVPEAVEINNKLVLFIDDLEPIKEKLFNEIVN